MPAAVKLAAAEFGADRATLVFACILTGHQIGAAIAAVGTGLSHDALAIYLPAFFTGGMLCLVSSRLSLMVGRQRSRSVSEQAA